MMLGEISAMDGWILGCTIVGAITGVGALVVAVVAVKKKQDVRVEQPLNIKLLEEFVSRRDFHEHVQENRAAHEGIHSKIGGVERGAQAKLDHHIGEIRKDIKQDVTGIHSRVDEILAAVSELKGSFSERKGPR